MDKSVFLDTSYILALVFQDDDFHKIANNISNKISSERINVLTTELILIEIADSLSKVKFRQECIITIEKLRKFETVVDITQDRMKTAWSLYEKMSDKEWGFTDCYSFVVMKKYDIKQALTTDKHFEQAGFERLLK